MSLEVYYPQDIHNALLAAEQATASALQASCEVDARYSQGYDDGYHAALMTLALAFGLIGGADDSNASYETALDNLGTEGLDDATVALLNQPLSPEETFKALLELIENEAQKIRGFPHNLLRADWRG